ncbi:DUF5958 family protein [Streptomyces cinnamoneus]|uniref:Uncharacterized protein n=1 Tax=Streptomyces cinnamoneus TaxID=53446 RepID=A0A918WJQ4_STRCJ|nr:DUF5958 family protein [Streptomyces cinnamoneus]GHC53896.1 hypothetical protein GCM10010507_32740 [Streptomyces cinnamoneus]
MDDVREPERIINELAQGLRAVEDGVSWFSGLSEGEREAVLREVVRCISQVHPTAEEARASVARSGLKPTANPAVMIHRAPLMERVGRIAGLPADEHVNAFRLLVALFSLADTRRRETECRGRCGHFWHNLP